MEPRGQQPGDDTSPAHRAAQARPAPWRSVGGTAGIGTARPVAGVAGGALLWTAVGLTGMLLVGSRSDTAVETGVDRRVDGGAGAVWHGLAQVIAVLFEPVAGLIVIAALGVALRIVVGRSRGWGFVAVTAVPWLSTEVVKVLVDRARPDLGQGFPTAPPDSGSFPSGHTALAVALALGIGWLFVGRRRVLVTVVGLVLAGVVGVSRLVLGVHYPTDVLASFVATTAVFLVVSSLLALTPWWRRGRCR